MTRPPPTAPEPPEPPCPPEWERPKGIYGPQHVGYTIDRIVREVRAGSFVIPDFQRPAVWTDAQILYLMDSLAKGFHVGSIIAWKRYVSAAGPTGFGTVNDGKGAYLIVDGQQRIRAVYTALTSGRFGFDCRTKEFVLIGEPDPEVFPLTLMHKTYTSDSDSWVGWYDKLRAWTAAVTHGDFKYGYISDCFLNRELSVVTLDYSVTIEQIIETFRRINTTGTLMSQADLEEGLRRCQG